MDDFPPTVDVQYILPGWVAPLTGETIPVEVQVILPSSGRILIEFMSEPGKLYGIEYMNNWPTNTWHVVPLRLRAGANRTQWIDAGPPATEPPSGVRVYRVKELAD
ncbi:MAG: hypothetical protein EOM10_09845 [Opitutae bacterium]|nr:hypothetical protein [Opitutae bacterium]